MKKNLNKINKIAKVIKFEGTYAGQELFIIVGILMVLATLMKLTSIIYLDSDWFWFIAGLGLMVEGIVSMVKQKRFNQKYKVLSREEFERLMDNQNK